MAHARQEAEGLHRSRIARYRCHALHSGRWHRAGRRMHRLPARFRSPRPTPHRSLPSRASTPGSRRWSDQLSRRYQIAPEATGEIVAAAYRAAPADGLDPLLVLAVISIESRFNPLAESSMGAKGLMQIIPKFHRAKLAEHGGDHAVLDPESNISVGARILREYIHRTGTLETGLQFYNGASRDESGQYAHKVLAERQRLEQALLTAGRHRRRLPREPDRPRRQSVSARGDLGRGGYQFRPAFPPRRARRAVPLRREGRARNCAYRARRAHQPHLARLCSGSRPGQLYAYRVYGPEGPQHRFDPDRRCSILTRDC